MPSSPRHRGAQPGNKNASKVNRDAKALANPTPIPDEISELLDRSVRLLNRLMVKLEQYVDEHEQDLTEEETRKIIRAVTFASLAAQRILRAKQLQPPQEKTFQDYINDALTQLNEEQGVKDFRSEASGGYTSLPDPLLPLA